MVANPARKFEDVDPGCIRAASGELLLSFLFFFTSVGSSMAAENLGGGKDGMAGSIANALANGMMVATIVSAGLHISGAHLNPVVSLVMLAGQRISLLRSVLYVVVQLLASSLACILLRFLAGGAETPVHKLGSGVGLLQGLGMEMVLTSSLILTVYATIVDPVTDIFHGLGSLFVGLYVGLSSIAGGPYTGASMNPARSFGPALVSLNWTDHWVYWIGPMLGGLLSGFIYERYFIKKTF